MLIIENIRIFDGNDATLFPGRVRIEKDKITAVARGDEHLDAQGGKVIDGHGATLMPGMIDGHAHFAFPFAVDRQPPMMEGTAPMMAMMMPPERLILSAAHNAAVMLDHGFTGAYSAGAGTLLMDVSIKEDIDKGYIAGPRMVPAGQEGDALEMVTKHTTTAELIKAVREGMQHAAQVGAKVSKFILSGPNFIDDTRAMWADVVLEAAHEEAQQLGLWMSGHARPLETIRQGLLYGFRVLYHCDELDEQTLDMAEARKDQVFIGPSIGLLGKYLNNKSPQFAFMEPMCERYMRYIPELRKRGIRMVVGGDYGFPELPHGRYADDLVNYTKHFGVPSIEVLRSATKVGGELLDMPVGQVREDYLADLLLVAGNPIEDLSVLTDKANIKMVMKGGHIHRLDPNS